MGTCLGKEDGVLAVRWCDGKCVKAGKCEVKVGCGLESGMAET
jgi:hypothetical protein